MANIKSAIKRIKQNEKRRLRNRTVRTRVRAAVKSARRSLEDKTPATAETVRAAMRTLDRAVTKGVVHRNTAARKKSALARRLNAIA